MTRTLLSRCSRWIAVSMLGFGVFLSGCTSSSSEPAKTQPLQAGFETPEKAVEAFVIALRNNDQESLKKILGPDARQLIDTGDDVSDKAAGARFLASFDAKHRLVAGTDDRITLVVGEKDWPLPMPLVKDTSDGLWFFDSEAGIEEILNRRIGENELSVIEVCQAIVDAQYDYALADPNGDGIAEYAAKFISDKGTKNGLYWPTAPGEPGSPLGPLVGEAVEEGYAATPLSAADEPRPYHGYCYRLLTSQGSHATGGARDYRVGDRLIGGFAVVAYPASYASTGIMTFITNQDGIVFQRDLGEKTVEIVRAMKSFDPDPRWAKVTTAEKTGEPRKP